MKISIFIAKFVKSRGKGKRFEFLKHYNYGCIGEYEFSASNTPLIHYHRRPFKKQSLRDDVYSTLFCWQSFGGGFKVERGREYSLDALTYPTPAGELLELEPPILSDDDSVDQRAEIFIRKFYEDMRLQAQDSFLADQ
ncbi:Protein of unknown function DUF761, plant [Dillenia turbinata]|uniref:Uncharacterized protein n=1 Tax=Dillenia turbinata TaxID=194707 RepID=A0AAN8VDK7_9MAGN